LAFVFCFNLNNVTFATGSNIVSENFGDMAFPEDNNAHGGNTLKTAYLAASTKAGTYKRELSGSTWTKQ